MSGRSINNDNSGNYCKDSVYMNSDSEYESSSPKKSSSSGLKNHFIANNNEEVNLSKSTHRNLLLEHKNSTKEVPILQTFADENLYDPKIMAEKRIGTNEHAFKDNDSSYKDNDIESSDLDAESTILKVTNFINGKREELGEHEERLQSPLIAGKNDMSRMQTSGSDKSDNDHKKCGKTHAKNCRNRLRYTEKYASDTPEGRWSKNDWIRFYSYLKVWKRTRKLSITDISRLKKAFNCDTLELELRIKVLKSIVAKKKRAAFQKRLDHIIETSFT